MTTQKSTELMARIHGAQRGIGLASLMLLASVSLLAGCGGMVNDAPSAAVPGGALQGNVHGGQQPVVGATITVYDASVNTGYGAAAVALVTSPSVVQTNASGDFSFTSLNYPSNVNGGGPVIGSDLLYIVATQGNPGGGNNINLAETALLGADSGISSLGFIVVNEETTIASAYALEGFMNDYAHVGTSSTNTVGLTNAFATFNNLVNLNSGLPLSQTPYYSVAANGTGTSAGTFSSVVPSSELYSLGDILATCVNTQGIAGANPGPCNALFSATTSAAGGDGIDPDTTQAALYIAKHPGTNVTALYNLIPNQPQWAGLASAPPDWTVALQFIGGGLGYNGTTVSNSNGLVIDGVGDIWVGNSGENSITELSNLGAPLSPNSTTSPVASGGFTNAALNLPAHLAIDTSNHVYVGAKGQIVEFNAGGTFVQTITGGGLSTKAVVALAIDKNGYIWADDGSLVAEFNGSTPLSGTGFDAANGDTDINNPDTVVVDASDNIWIESKGNGNVVKLNESTGAELHHSGTQLSSPVASSTIDGSGQFWAICTTPNPEVLKFSAAGAISGTYNSINSVVEPQSISIDGGGHFWVPDQGNSPNWITEVSGTGTALSPSAGYGLGTSSPMNAVGANEPDSSGNLWVLVNDSSYAVSGSQVTEFVGLATPTATPLAAAVVNGTIGQKP
jgi:hypothetical protein